MCTVHHIAMCGWPTRCTILINNFLFHPFFLALHVSNELLVHNQEHCLVYCVIQYTRQCSWWWTSNSFETCRARKKGWNKKLLIRIVHLVGHLHIIFVLFRHLIPVNCLNNFDNDCLYKRGTLRPVVSLTQWPNTPLIIYNWSVV